MAALLHLTANIKCLKGNYDEADKLYRQSLNIFKKQGKQPGVAICIYSLGQLAERRGKLSAAAQYYEKSLKLFINMNQKHYEKIAREGLERVRSNLSRRNASHEPAR
jgi:tetratricopeptide (TPR) repeat protein